MNHHQLITLCERFQLGSPIAEPQPVLGGLMHRIWHLSTTQGDFAVKQLNPEIMRKPGIHDRYRLTERIAAAMAAQGVPAVTAFPCADGPVQEIDGISALVFPWIDGTILPPGPANPAQARQIGVILGTMHTLQLSVPGLDIPIWRVFRDDDWVLLARRGTERQLPWAEHLRGMLRDLRWWSRLAQDANKRLWSHLVVSHGDLDQKNVLWQNDGTFAIIDWDAAGLVNPAVDLAGSAVLWSRQADGASDEAAFRAVIDGYRRTGSMRQESASDALASCLGNWLEWLEVNLRRSLHASTPADEQVLAISETLKTLVALQTLADHMGIFAAWMDI